jgi:hypothetical protein
MSYLPSILARRTGLPSKIVLAAIISSASLAAQELEPRAYSVSPEGTNFVVLATARSFGDISFDPALPLEDAKATLNGLAFGYGRTIDFAGRSASIAVTIPYTWGPIQAVVRGSFEQTRRSGLVDPGFRFAVNLYGAPTMDVGEFKKYRQRTNIGFSLTGVVPLGQYSPTRFINIGSNRWAVKPEIGISHHLGRWYFDTYLGVWLFTANNNFNGSVRTQDPLGSAQVHVSYNITRRIWAAFDANFYTGGRTTLNGVSNADLQRNSRVGGTIAIPVTKSQSVKFNYSTGARGNIGASFTSIGIAYQYRWGVRL